MTATPMIIRPAITPQRRPSVAVPAAKPAEPSAATAGKVLVVDDNNQVRSAVTRFLRLHAFQVDVAPDGRTALNFMQREIFDFVLLDVDMPGMNGFEVCKRIKEDPNHVFTPVIMLTALDSSEDRIKGAEAGCDGYLAKPVPPAELIARVKAGIRQRALIFQAVRVAKAATERVEPRVQPPVQRAARA